MEKNWNSGKTWAVGRLSAITMSWVKCGTRLPDRQKADGGEKTGTAGSPELECGNLGVPQQGAQ